MPHARRHLAAFASMGVDLVLGGHLHRAYIGNSLDVLPSHPPDTPVVIVQSGTTSSSRGRARERMSCSFNEIRFDEVTIEVTHHHLDRGAGEFRPTGLHLFPRHPRRALPADAPDRALEALRRVE
jgi:hypothetical protein